MTVWRIEHPRSPSSEELSLLCAAAELESTRLDADDGNRVRAGDLVVLSFDARDASDPDCARLRAAGARVVLFAPPDAEIDPLLASCDDVVRAGCSAAEFGWRCARLVPHAAGDATRAPANDFESYGLVGEAPLFRHALHRLERFAAAEIPLSLGGETGTGKELAARAAHYLGPRADGPFIPVNCGALPDTLLENELFGHHAGAFTGGSRPSEGLVAKADGGSLFLDEIDCLSLRAQAALLRFLQDREYRPLGGGPLLSSDCRVITASNTRLDHAVAAGRLREDLYYRLVVAEVTLPPLRERPGDASLLAVRFLEEVSAPDGPLPRRFGSGVLAWIEDQPWTGNVRELRAFVERQALLSDAPVIERIDGAEGMSTDKPRPAFGPAKAAAVAAFEQRYLREVLDEALGNVARAARLAGKERRAFYRLLAKYDLVPRRMHRVEPEQRKAPGTPRAGAATGATPATGTRPS